MEAKRILLAVTADMSLGLMHGFPEKLASEGWEVHVACSPGPKSAMVSDVPGVSFHAIAMERDPSVNADVRAFFEWLRVLRLVKPDITSIGTPKAALLGGLACVIAGVPRRVYVLRGLRYETSRGVPRFVLKLLERLTCLTAHEILAVSESLRGRAIADRLARQRKITVIGRGSSNGVDVTRFSAIPGERIAARMRRWPGSEKVPTIGFVGRIHPDKGLDLLAESLAILARDGSRGRLLVVGGSDTEAGEDLKSRLRGSGFDVEFTGAVDDVAPFLSLIDVLCLPTKREGFPNVVLEAGAARIPTVATMATGVTDAIIDGKTGTVCTTRDPEELANALQRLLESETLRTMMGAAAQSFVAANFERKSVQTKLARYYCREWAGSAT